MQSKRTDSKGSVNSCADQAAPGRSDINERIFIILLFHVNLRFVPY